MIRQPEQNKSTSRKSKTADDNRGTEERPLIIKGIPAPRDTEKDQEDRREREVKTQLDREMTRYTGWQAFFTLVLIGVGAWQVWLFRGQLSIMEETQKAAQTAVQLTHRPRLRMRRVIIESEGINQSGNIRYTIANIGNAKATITRGVAKVAYFESTAGWPKFPDSFDGPNIPPYTIEAGAQFSGPLENEEVMQAFANVGFIPHSTMRLYFFGSIWYLDELGNYRETSFLRQYNGTRFVPIDNPDYEYED